MSLSARIVSIGAAITCTAKNSAGVWRSLALNDLIFDGEEIKAVAPVAQFNFIAYVLQRKIASAWTDAVIVKLDLQSGTSHYRQDRWRLSGNDLDSTVTLGVTTDKGQTLLRDAQIAQKQDEFLYGGNFLYSGTIALSVAPIWWGVFSNVDETTKLERAFEEEIDATLICNREQFYTAGLVPLIGQQITWNARAYRIERLRTDEIAYEFILCSINK
jgi:hypothetical protein